MGENKGKLLKTIAKITVSLLLLYFIFTKIDLTEVLNVLQSANPWWGLFALVLFVGSKILNAYRLNCYFHSIEVRLTTRSNLELYLLGMFYNLFLPGGIGGDAYKGYVIQKAYQTSTKRVVAVLLLDRLSGLLLILMYALLLGAFLDIPWLINWRWLPLIAIPLGLLVFRWMVQQWFSYTLPVFWITFGYSALLQLTQLGATLCILKALGVTTDTLAYLFVFMISSIVSVLPLTIGGIGSREITFLYGAKWLGLDAGNAISASFSFFILTALVSLVGIIFHFRKPRLQTIDH
ncbi:MAG: lysylphosphatidylglycerol synthase transmembrane domain-containing protein [Bacteroidota bacterium]